ncbi:hypothetical protein PN498_10365 [Oscillatoria sp. CS-180]|nr:hypothetical protein [Oscillatoria sp. CS-180]MDB9526391.1 hypothetical protein [Oscillatoria sp. CS-180]
MSRLISAPAAEPAHSVVEINPAKTDPTTAFINLFLRGKNILNLSPK